MTKEQIVCNVILNANLFSEEDRARARTAQDKLRVREHELERRAAQLHREKFMSQLESIEMELAIRGESAHA